MLQMPSNQKEKIHSMVLGILTFVGLIFILLPSTPQFKVGTWLIVLGLYFYKGLKLKTALRLILYALFFSVMFLVLFLLYPSERHVSGEDIVIYKYSVNSGVLKEAISSFLRIAALSHLSMASSIVISYSHIILLLLSKGKIRSTIGYPLMVALNSINLFKDEFNRIKLANKFRGLGTYRSLFIVFPLLVFAIRHSQRGALSLVTRGINTKKRYYYNYDMNSLDYFILISVSGFILVSYIFTTIL